jgi:hypothetical protein
MFLFLIFFSCALGDGEAPQYSNPEISNSVQRSIVAAEELTEASEQLESYIDQVRREQIPRSEQQETIGLLMSQLEQKEKLLQEELRHLKSSFKVKEATAH